MANESNESKSDQPNTNLPKLGRRTAQAESENHAFSNPQRNRSYNTKQAHKRHKQRAKA